jgi:hypothetical protein
MPRARTVSRPKGLTFGRMDSLPATELRAELSYWSDMAERSSGATQIVASRHAQRCVEILRSQATSQ